LNGRKKKQKKIDRLATLRIDDTVKKKRRNLYLLNKNKPQTLNFSMERMN
jgi:hypothetical protein